jgi:hypothetical protein
MMAGVDPSAYCDEHVGELYPPRCRLCESLAIEYDQIHLPAPTVGSTTEKEEI